MLRVGVAVYSPISLMEQELHPMASSKIRSALIYHLNLVSVSIGVYKMFSSPMSKRSAMVINTYKTQLISLYPRSLFHFMF